MEKHRAFYTLPEVAEMLKVSRQTVYRWIRSGELEAYKLGHDWRVEKTDLDRFLESRRGGAGE